MEITRLKTTETRSIQLEYLIRVQYLGTEAQLPYHGLPHVLYIAHYSPIFGRSQQIKLTETDSLNTIQLHLLHPTGLVHDLNHLTDIRGGNPIDLRQSLLIQAGYTSREREFIESVIEEEEASMDRSILPSTWDVACLRDAGIAYQVDPERKRSTTIGAFTQETGEENKSHAHRIVTRQQTWIANMQKLGYQGIFYTNEAQKLFGQAVEDDLSYWQSILVS